MLLVKLTLIFAHTLAVLARIMNSLWAAFWLCSSRHRTVQPSATVSSFDPLCEVQSDKATVEITSPFDGVIKEILVNEGEVAKVGAGLCLIEVEEADVDGADPSVIEKPQQSSPETPTASEPERKQEITIKHEPTRRPHPLDPNAPPSALNSTNDTNVLATPSVRHFARSKGVDLAKLAPGSGRDGRIEKADVEAFLAGASRSQPTVAEGEDVIVELGRTRYGMWKAMTKVVFLLSAFLINLPAESRNPTFWIFDFIRHNISL